MNGSGRTVAKNASALLISQVTTWALTLILTIVLPRYLGSTSMGKLALANSIWAIGGVIVTFGMDTLLVKEIARSPNKASELFGASVGTRALMHLLVFGGILLYLFVFRYPVDTMIVVCIVGGWQLVLGTGQCLCRGASGPGTHGIHDGGKHPGQTGEHHCL